MLEWEVKPLAELADIRVSNVDKKSVSGELPVRLCNYMDVYAGRYLANSDRYMEATCTTRELAAFGLRRFDVLITKDSESPDDIGIPALIDDDVQELVCGYRLAVLRLRSDEIDPVVLLKQLESERLRRYFGQRAGGSTRYGLSTRAIAQAPILVPPQEIQRTIAAVHRSLDTQITHTEALIAKQEQVRDGLTQDLFTRGVDETGRLRPPREEAPALYHETALGWLPKGWNVVELGRLASVERGRFGARPRNDPRFYGGDIPFIQTSDVAGAHEGMIVTFSQTLNEKGVRTSRIFRDGSIMVSIAANIGDTSLLTFDACAPDSVVGVVPNKGISPIYLRSIIATRKRSLEARAPQTAQRNINLQDLRPLKLPTCDEGEQERIESLIGYYHDAVFYSRFQLAKLNYLRIALVRDLLTQPVAAAAEPRIAAE